VFVHGALWDAVSSANIASGRTVVVRQVDGLQLQVDPVSSPQPGWASTSA